MLPRFRLPVTRWPAMQRGVISVLTVVVVGLSLTASVLAASYYLRGRQANTVAVHAQTQAQLNAWTAAEVLRTYLDKLHQEGKLTDFMALSVNKPISLSFSGSHPLKDHLHVEITNIDNNATPPTVTAKIVGTTVEGTRARSSALLETVFAVEVPSGGSCTVGLPLAALYSRSSVTIGGGETSFYTTTSGSSNLGLQNLSVGGDIVINSSSQAGISGCAKGNITIGGGGIKPNGRLYAEHGVVDFQQLTMPSGTDVWAQNITVGNSGGSSFKALRAGAYIVKVEDAQGVEWGQARIGGSRLVSNPSYVLPPVLLNPGSPTRTPLENEKVVIRGTLPGSADMHEKWLLNLAKVTVDRNTGKITGAASAFERLKADVPALPNVLYLRYQGVWGGTVNVYSQTVDLVWGQDVNFTGWQGKYATVKAAGNVTAYDAEIATLLAGGNLTGKALTDDHQFGNSPKITANSKIGGNVLYSYGSPIADAKVQAQWPRLQIRQPMGEEPGLPGVPYCDTRVPPVNVDIYKSQANYVFEVVNGAPQVTVRNVLRRNGSSLDGVYALQTGTPRNNAWELMSCGWNDDVGCLFDITTSGSQWTFTGLKKFPLGMVWFDGPVSLSVGFAGGLRNTILAKGDITLVDAGSNNQLKSPVHAGKEKMCQDTTVGHYPANICTALNNNQTPALGNMAIMTTSHLRPSGWTIHGNIQAGGEALNTGAVTQVYGSVGLGMNEISDSSASFGFGGFIVTTDMSTPAGQEQLLVPGGICADGSIASGTSSGSSSTTNASAGQSVARMLWSRYN